MEKGPLLAGGGREREERACVREKRERVRERESGEDGPARDRAQWGVGGDGREYRGTSLIRKRTPLGPYRRPMPRVLGWS